MFLSELQCFLLCCQCYVATMQVHEMIEKNFFPCKSLNFRGCHQYADYLLTLCCWSASLSVLSIGHSVCRLPVITLLFKCKSFCLVHRTFQKHQREKWPTALMKWSCCVDFLLKLKRFICRRLPRTSVLLNRYVSCGFFPIFTSDILIARLYS